MMQSPFDELHPSASLRPVLEDSTSSLLSNAFRSIVKYAAPESLARVVGKAFHEDVHGPFQDAVLDREAEMDDGADDEASNELDFPIKSCLLMLQAIKEECRDSKSYVPLVQPLTAALQARQADSLSRPRAASRMISSSASV